MFLRDPQQKPWLTANSFLITWYDLKCKILRKGKACIHNVGQH